jgi:hypothetical protein
MDYYQGVVAEYLRANRSTFVNPEFCLQLDAGLKSPAKGRHWYVDLLAVCLSEKSMYLCEVTYAKTGSALTERLKAWSTHWPTILEALQRDAGVSAEWAIRPWLFVPEPGIPALLQRLPKLPVTPRITPLEMTQPWSGHSGWDRHGEAAKPKTIPPEMQT